MGVCTHTGVGFYTCTHFHTQKNDCLSGSVYIHRCCFSILVHTSKKKQKTHTHKKLSFWECIHTLVLFSILVYTSIKTKTKKLAVFLGVCTYTGVVFLYLYTLPQKQKNKKTVFLGVCTYTGVVFYTCTHFHQKKPPKTDCLSGSVYIHWCCFSILVHTSTKKKTPTKQTKKKLTVFLGVCTYTGVVFYTCTHFHKKDRLSGSVYTHWCCFLCLYTLPPKRNKNKTTTTTKQQ